MDGKLACVIATAIVTVAVAPAAAVGPSASGSTAAGGGLPSAATPAASGGLVAAGPAAAAAGRPVQDANCSFPVTRTDATGTRVTVEAEPQRIVTLAPSAAQTTWEIGAEDKVVGVSQFAAYLEGAGDRTNVSGPGRTPTDVEVVVGLEPDLVLAPNVIPNDTVRKLRDAGVTVYRFRAAGSFEDVYEKTLLTGRLTGECEGARETVDWMRDRVERVREAVAGRERPRVLYYFFGFTAGDGTFVHEVITTAGGRNVAAEAGITGFERPSEEVVVEQNPECLVLNSQGPQVPRTAAFNGTVAVRENRTVVVDGNYVSQPGPRIVYPLETVATALHPGAFAAPNGTTPAPRCAPSRAGGSVPIPGPGVGGALVALVAGALLSGRRR